ncbi:hypothetical protein NPIL_264641, partial [Nephila pilipes]
AECPKNQHKETCAPTCQTTCKNRNNKGLQLCNFACFIGCVCDEGYIKLDDLNGPCVEPRDCPS